MVLNAIDIREKKSDIPNEIKVGEFFRDMFTDSNYRFGSKGRVIKELRENHKEKPRHYKGRKKYNLMTCSSFIPKTAYKDKNIYHT